MSVSVDLVYPGSVTGSANYASEPPLGPLALYSSTPEEQRERIRFLDSTLLGDDQIITQIRKRRADVVALSCTTYNYPNALRAALEARKHGATVIAGGIHITHLRDKVLALMAAGERPFDYLMYGAAEPGFSRLLAALENGRDLADIPGLAYVENGRTVVNPPERERWRTDPLQVPLDYRPIDFQAYFSRFQQFGRLSDVAMAAPMFTQRGCVYGGNHKCVFCSIEHMNPRMPSDLIEENIVDLIENHGVDHIRISDGDFTSNPRHMAAVADAAERASARTGIKPSFYCFARADEIDRQRVQHLERLNVIAVFIGYESGSDKMLRAMHKFTTRQQNIQATELLCRVGIDVTCAGLVLGGPGEDRQTLDETLAFSSMLTQFENVRSLVATPLIPLPGSPSFQQLLFRLRANERQIWNQWHESDILEPDTLVKAWNSQMHNLPLEEIIDATKEISSLLPIGISLMRFCENPNTTSVQTRLL